MTIVYCDIVGDLFHYGHAKLFEKCKNYGDILYVGICGDEVVESYKRKPILNTYERNEIIKRCKLVDKTIINCPCPITKEFIQKHNIDIVIHANDMNKENLNNWYKVPIEMGIFKTVEYEKNISTSIILKRILERYKIET